MLPRCDLAITLTSPPGLAAVGWLLRIIRGTRFWSWEMDLYPDVAVGVGTIRKDSWIACILTRALDAPRRAADGVITLGTCMRRRILSHGANPTKVFIAENWSDGRAIVPKPFPPESPLLIQYSGNLGLAHEVDTIAAAMLELSASSEHRFEFIGDGVRRPDLVQFANEHRIPNIRFGPYVARDQISDSLGSCHIGLVTLLPACLGTVVPSKVYSLLAAGRPFLFIGPNESTPADLIRRHACGWHVEPGDVKGVVSILQLLAGEPWRVKAAGDAARTLFEASYDRPIGAARVADLLVGPRTMNEMLTDHETAGRLTTAGF